MKNKALKKLSQAAFWSFWGILLSNVIGFFYRIPLARMLGTNKYGLFCLGMSFLGFFHIISMVGFKNGLVRTLSLYLSGNENSKAKSTLFASLFITLACSSVITTFIFIFAPFIAKGIFHKPELTPILRILSFVIPISALAGIFLAVFKSSQKIMYMVFFEKIADKFFRLLIIAPLLFFGFGLPGALIGVLISSILTLTLEIIAYKKSRVFNHEKTAQLVERGKELLHLSLPLLFTGFLFVTTRYFDIFCIGFFCETNQVGIYDASSNLALFLIIFSTSIVSLQLPVISSLWAKKETAKISVIYTVMIKWILLCSVPACLLCAFFSKEILSLIYGSSYLLGNKVFILFLIGVITRAWSRPAGTILTSMGKTYIQLKIFIVITLLNIVLNILLIPSFGIEGAAMATILSFALLDLLNIFFVYKYIKIHPFSKSLISIFFSTAAASPSLLLYYYFSLPFLISFIICSIAYLSLYYLFTSLTGALNEENKYIQTALKKYLKNKRFPSSSSS